MLVLDEPTNDLDIESLELLEAAGREKERVKLSYKEVRELESLPKEIEALLMKKLDAYPRGACASERGEWIATPWSVLP